MSSGVWQPALSRQRAQRRFRQRAAPASLDALADAWYCTLDTRNSGRLTQADFAFFALLVPKPAGAAAPPAHA